MTSSEERWLAELQRGIPLEPRPFEALACELGCSEDDLVEFVSRCRREGLVRRFGAVFDTRRLGYRSVLCAVRIPPFELDAAAAKITPLVGVTHCYVREPQEVEKLNGSCASSLQPFNASTVQLPNLWFTLSYPSEVFAAMADEVKARLAPHAVQFLPATKRYKVDVVFGAATRARDESTEDGSPVTAQDRRIIGAFQGDTEVRVDYFSALAERIGMREWDLLSTLEIWRRKGRLKRIGLLLAHRTAGYVANGMCCWRVGGDTTETGRALAACDEVTHCYERPFVPEFAYNLFAMIHCTSTEEAQAQFARLHETVERSLNATGKVPSIMLLSTKEYKKTSMTFFA